MPGGCTRCLSLNHRSIDCFLAPRCVACFNYGHKFKFCLTRSRPNILWQPKTTRSFEWASLTNLAGVEAEEARGNSISPPIPTAVLTEEENPTLDTEPVLSEETPPPCSQKEDQLKEAMANFAVNLAPFVPYGLEVEDWARPARGRIVISGNPPHRHEEYAIATIHPPPH